MSQELANLIETVNVAEYVEGKSRVPAHLRGQGLTFFSQNDMWFYVAEGPIETNCDRCKELDAQDFVGAHLRALFPDLVIVDEDTISPNVHMTLWGKDTCKCVLRRMQEPYDTFGFYSGDKLEPYKAEEIKL